MNWKEFDALQLVERKYWPRTTAMRFFQINPLGEVRYLDARLKPQYRTLKPVVLNGENFFMATIGWTGGCQCVVRKPISELVKKYFPE